MQLHSAFSLRENLYSLIHRPNDNYGFIDGLRAIAVMMILMYHSFYFIKLAIPAEEFKRFLLETPAYLAWVWNLEKSLEIFFVISGFLIARILFQEYKTHRRIELRRFYWRRYLRLTPLYVFAIAVYWLVQSGDTPNLWANILYVNNLLPFEQVSMSWTWSLAVEEQFYLIFPLLLVFLIMRANSPLVYIGMLLGLSFIINLTVLRSDTLLWDNTYSEIFFNNVLFKHFFDEYYNDLHTRFGGFVCGIAVAYLEVFHKERVGLWVQGPRLSPLLSLVALAYIVSAFFSDIYVMPASADLLPYNRFYMICSRNLFSMALAWLVLACLYPVGIARVLQAVLSARLWFPVAQLSYSMYLFHYMFIPLITLNLFFNLQYMGILYADERDHHEWLLVVFALLILMSMLWAVFTYLLIERPFMRLRDWRRSAVYCAT